MKETYSANLASWTLAARISRTHQDIKIKIDTHEQVLNIMSFGLREHHLPEY